MAVQWVRFAPSRMSGGHRNKSEAVNLKRQGVKAGVPDICLPVARGQYHGLYIELKYGNNKPSQKQLEWIAGLRAEGFAACVCYGWRKAADVITYYLSLNNQKG